MAYKLEVNNPSYPKGTPLDCDGILVENGGSYTLTAEDEMRFVGRNLGRSVKDVYGKGDVVKLTGTTELNKKDGGE